MEQLKWTEEEFVWVEQNLNLLRNAMSVDDQFRAKTYELYNKALGTNKTPTSCGRCWRNTKKQVILYYEKIRHIY